MSTTVDPQLILDGVLKESDQGEFIVFRIPLALFELVCIVPIPEKGDKTSVFVKFKVAAPRASSKDARRPKS